MTSHRQIPLRFNDASYYGRIDPEHLCLHYTIFPSDFRQKRFKNRLIAEPRINLSQYEFKAVVDWLEICVTTEKPHVAVNLQRYLMKQNETLDAFSTCFVLSPTRTTHHCGRVLVIKMQDPRPTGLRLLLSALLRAHCAPGSKLSNIPVTGIEISLDVYPQQTFSSDGDAYATRRMLMTDLLRKHISISDAFREGKRRPRFVFQLGSKRRTQFALQPTEAIKRWARKEAPWKEILAFDLSARFAEAHKQPFIDSTFYYGMKDERLFFRCMDKITDRRSEEDVVNLPLTKTRSRLEFAFIDETPGDKLGPASSVISSVEDIALRGLKRFNSLMRFETPVFTPDKIEPHLPDSEEWGVFCRSGVAGLSHKLDVEALCRNDTAALRAAKRKEAITSGTLPRHRELNTRVSKALRRLEARWQRNWKKGCPKL